MKAIICSLSLAVVLFTAYKYRETIEKYNPFIGYTEKAKGQNLNYFGYPISKV